MMTEEGEIKQISGEWFMFIDSMPCDKCEDHWIPVGWYNIDRAVKRIIQLNDKRR